MGAVEFEAQLVENRPITLEALATTLDALQAAGVPGGARLMVRQLDGVYEVRATWTPTATVPLPPEWTSPVDAPPYLKDPEPAPLPVEEVFPCHRCGDPIVADGSKKSGYRHQYEDALRTAHAAIRYRPIRDNPQA